ncbi:ParB/RepB/Spo0J family partition protein, partial [Intestinibacillus massiliensis]|uniref:ParB/RepB/Spo0J family partition protein n=1 Tax=Intestinibacillus massiliensis TaxID=1871029 RepID=UPI000B35DB56
MANENSRAPTATQAQIIPLAKIHNLPGVNPTPAPDRAYGGLVSSIQSSGVLNPVILRLREDGEYQIVAGFRRRRASELAKKTDIPALVYDMTEKEAVEYFRRRNQPDAEKTVPGKLIPAPVPAAAPGKEDKGKAADEGKKPGEVPASAAAPAKDDKAKPAADGKKPGENPAPAVAPVKDDKAKPADDGKKPGAAPAPATAPGKDDKSKAADEGKKPGEAPASAVAPGKEDKDKAADEGKKPDAAPAPAAAPSKEDTGKAADEGKKPGAVPAPAAPGKEDKGKAADEGKKLGAAPTPAAAPGKDDKGKAADAGKKPAEAPAPAAAPGKEDKGKAADDGKKPSEAPAPAAAPGKEDKGKAADEGKKPGEAPAPAAAPGKEDKGKSPDGKVVDFPKTKPAAAPTGPAASGPTGTAITQVFDPRLNPPDDKALNDLPIPKEGESHFITLHPGYLEKSEFNNFSVDREAEDFLELQKSIELTGVKDPVLARPKEGGGLEILSGQRRHIIATILNYPVPTIIQRIDDDDAKILVADSNLHRPKISSYDLSRALRMKMDGMKRKAGRRKKNDPGAPALNTDEALAKEMGMTVSKLNRLLRLSEATKDVCARYDAGTLELSIAYAISFLKPENQDSVLRLSDLGYKLSTVRIERMKPVDKGGKLTEKAMRDILDDKDLAPKQTPPSPAAPATPAAPAAPATPATPATPANPSAGNELPHSPD